MEHNLIIDNRILDMVTAILREHAHNAEIWAYGSRVSGKFHEGSDLDLVLRNDKGLEIPYAEFSRLRTSFQESDIPILIDIQDWATLPEYFQHEIERHYVTIKKSHS